MAMWRCPHCGTPQAEAARCWVCHRSSTTCSTCRHFRRSLATTVGLCGIDRRRAPLRGTEHRGCWEPVAASVEAGSSPVTIVEPEAERQPDPAVLRLRGRDASRRGILEGFVPIELVDRGPRTLQPAEHQPVPPPRVIEAVESWTDRETLFGDA